MSMLLGSVMPSDPKGTADAAAPPGIISHAQSRPRGLTPEIFRVVLFATSFCYLVISETGCFFKKDEPADDKDDKDKAHPQKQDD